MSVTVHVGDLVVATPYPDLHRTSIGGRPPATAVWNISVLAGDLLLVATTPSQRDVVLKVFHNGQLIEVLRSDVMLKDWVS